MLDPQKIKIVKLRLLSSSIKVPESMSLEPVESFGLNIEFSLGFNIKDRAVKADLTLHIGTDEDTEAEATYHFVYFFQVDNLDELAQEDEAGAIKVDANLGNALASIAYSTSRGLLVEQLKHTVFENFMLPVIDPNELLSKGS